MSGIPNPLSGMTFQSGWNSCMARSYCKYPVIAGIIIGSLIVLSVLWCLVQIICCGAQCCFCCASISKCLCCRCCRGSGGSSRPPRNQYVSPLAHDNPYGAQKTGYVNPSQYESGFGNHSNVGAFSGGPGYAGQGQYRSQPAPKYATATFEEPSKRSNVNGDALPAMPSWNDARSTRVEETSPERPGEDVEMGRLNSAGTLPKFESDNYMRGDSAHGSAAGVGTAAAVGAGAGAAAGAYGYGRQNSYGSNVAGAGYGQERGQAQPGYEQARQSPYGQRDEYRTNGGYGQYNANSSYGRQEQNYSQPSYGVQGANDHGYDHGNTSPVYTATPGYAVSQAPPQQGYRGYSPTRTQPPPPQSGYAAYPGQSTYQSTDALSSQGTGNTSGERFYGASDAPPGRKPVQGSWKDL
ncbi:Mitochondria fission 1 protein [Sphaceloma murrayae]|uniref:Mitochondria fission 1 protein n=1 Tax=Sphaceloma murrayae TaxID=2082308 RepID=A0A2K1QHV8_9PEZI|nr:Mitochondria fission 1 protein [Sphaceloma murrayae]